MKVCNTCGKNKKLESFSRRKNGSYVARCKSCHAEYLRGYYAKNKDKYREKNRRDLPKYVERNARYILEYLMNHPCVDCGENDLDVLEFDHRESIGKNRQNSVLSIGNVFSLNRIEQELSLCDVRCGNCHNRRTRQQFGRSRNKLAEEFGLR